MAYKLVCIDVDGTLLNRRHKITETTKETIKRAHNTGVHIVISTGRMYTDAEYYSNLVGVKSPVIASNGAFIKEKDNDKVIYKCILGESLSLQVLEIFRKYNVKPCFCTPHKFYYGNILFKLVYFVGNLFGMRGNKIDSEYVYSWEKWRKVLHKEKDNIVKCEIICKDLNSIRELREELKKIKQLEIVCSSPHNIEITSKGVSKGKAVEMLATRLGLQREEIITIGDSENDLSMIEYAGLGIAMGNAVDSVKQKADFVTATNEQEGVAKAINRFVLAQNESELQSGWPNNY